MCRIQTNDGVGTGFLLKFKAPNGKERHGLLTCYHVLVIKGAAPELETVKIKFEQHPTEFELSRIVDLKFPPMFDTNLDFFYLEIDTVLLSGIQSLQVKFLELGQFPPKYEEIFVVHYPEGKARMVSVGKIMKRGTCEEGNPNIQHRTSTLPGSSGAPLIDSNGTDGFAFAMHKGRNIDWFCDCASLLQPIIAHITGQPWIFSRNPSNRPANQPGTVIAI